MITFTSRSSPVHTQFFALLRHFTFRSRISRSQPTSLNACKRNSIAKSSQESIALEVQMTWSQLWAKKNFQMVPEPYYLGKMNV